MRDDIDEQGQKMLAQFSQALRAWAARSDMREIQNAFQKLAIEVDDAIIAVVRARGGGA